MSNALRLGKISGILQDTANMIVDRIPRRAEFIYQARKLGFEGSEEILELLIEPKHADSLRIAAERTKSAMVDFDDLSQFEKDVMSRWIFVYPWLKGASVWTARFPKDHPIQAMAYAYLFYYQQQRLNEEFARGHPDYMATFIPFSMLPDAVENWEVPGTDYQPFQGHVTKDGEEVPRGVSGRQLFTFTTPYDLLRVATGWITNEKDAQAIVEMANPDLWGDRQADHRLRLLQAQGGRPRTMGSGHRRMMPGGDATILAENIRRALRDDATRKRSLYPTTATEDWMRVFLGSIFPTPVNPEVARKHLPAGAHVRRAAHRGVGRDGREADEAGDPSQRRGVQARPQRVLRDPRPAQEGAGRSRRSVRTSGSAPGRRRSGSSTPTARRTPSAGRAVP